MSSDGWLTKLALLAGKRNWRPDGRCGPGFQPEQCYPGLGKACCNVRQGECTEACTESGDVDYSGHKIGDEYPMTLSMSSQVQAPTLCMDGLASTYCQSEAEQFPWLMIEYQQEVNMTKL